MYWSVSAPTLIIIKNLLQTRVREKYVEFKIFLIYYMMNSTDSDCCFEEKECFFLSAWPFCIYVQAFWSCMSPLYIVSISKWIFKVIFVVMQALSEFVFHLLFLNEILRHLCSKNALFQRMRSMQQSYPKFFLEKSIHENRLQKCLFFFSPKDIQETRRFLQWWWTLSRSWSNRILI